MQALYWLTIDTTSSALKLSIWGTFSIYLTMNITEEMQ